MIYTRTPASAGVFQNGPGTPPAGTGSLTFSTPTSADKVVAFNYDHVGINWPTSTKWVTRPTAPRARAQVASINIEVDYNGAAPGGFTTLVFEPVYNTVAGHGRNGVWQTWDAYQGGQAIWWSSNPIPGVSQSTPS